MGLIENVSLGMGTRIDITDNVTEKGVILSKEESIKLSKFSVLVNDICDRIDYNSCNLGDSFTCKVIDPALLFIFDYDNMNNYAKIIMERGPITTGWSYDWVVENSKAGGIRNNDIKDLINNTKKFVYDCKTEEFIHEGYKFIFWSLMILAVDKSNEDEHISLICNFAKMLNITDKEIEDMIYIVKLIFNKVDDNYNFQSEKVVNIFGGVLNKYNYEF